jgi:hypothetical protein
LKLKGYTEIKSFSLFSGNLDPKQPLPSYLHSCYAIEFDCLEAGYASNNVNLPFISICDACKRYRDEINIGNTRITKHPNQWSCGRRFQCTQLYSSRTGFDPREGLYQVDSVSQPQINTPNASVISEQPPLPFSSPSENAILAQKEKLLQLQLQEASKTYESLKKLAAKNLVIIQEYNAQINSLTLQNKQLTLENQSLKTSLEENLDTCDDLFDTKTQLEHELEELQLTVDSNISVLSNQNEELTILLDGYRQSNADLLDSETNPKLVNYKKQVQSLGTELTLAKCKARDFELLVGTKVSFRDALHQLLVFHYGRHCSYEFLANKLLTIIQDPKFLESRCLDILYHIAECRAKNDMCPLTDPVAVAKATDSHGYIISHNCLDKLRQTRSFGKENNSNAKEWLASDCQVKAVIAEVDTKCQEMCPIFIDYSDGIEKVNLDYDASLIAFLKSFQLFEIAKTESVEMKFTLDAMNISDHSVVIISGLQMCDKWLLIWTQNFP